MSCITTMALAAAAAAAVAAFAGSGAAAGRSPAGSFFVLDCHFSHSAPDDPIVYPGQPGHSHDHVFIGNVSTNASSTPASLAGRGTTCAEKRDRSAYWAPMLYVAGTAVDPVQATIYYRRLTTGPVQPFPRGLVMVAGNSHAVSPQSKKVTLWYCGVLKSSFYGTLRRTPIAMERQAPASPTVPGLPACQAPTNLELQVNFPDCSNGKADSADHRSHMAYSVAGRCPASHPIAVPAISLILRYPPVSGSNIFLSSGGVYSGHADFMDSWDAKTLKSLVVGCLDHGAGCGAAAGKALDTT
jgi:hypothetical protein